MMQLLRNMVEIETRSEEKGADEQLESPVTEEMVASSVKVNLTGLRKAGRRVKAQRGVRAGR